MVGELRLSGSGYQRCRPLGATIGGSATIPREMVSDYRATIERLSQSESRTEIFPNFPKIFQKTDQNFFKTVRKIERVFARQVRDCRGGAVSARGVVAAAAVLLMRGRERVSGCNGSVGRVRVRYGVLMAWGRYFYTLSYKKRPEGVLEALRAIDIYRRISGGRCRTCQDAHRRRRTRKSPAGHTSGRGEKKAAHVGRQKGYESRAIQTRISAGSSRM